MKKISSIILALAAFLSFAHFGAAQSETTYKNGMGFSKKISGPDDKGVYTITLEAFTTGEVEVKQKSMPADIVLILDVSGSMAYDMNGNAPTISNGWYTYDNPNFDKNNVRIDALKNAVNAFIDQINSNDKKDDDGNDRESRLGNRIAIVTFSTNASVKNELTVLGTSLTNDSGVTTLKQTINNLTANGGTYTHKGMLEAYNILSELGDTRQLRNVVLFTDGDPGLWASWTSTDRAYRTDRLNNQYRQSTELAFIEGKEQIGGTNYDYSTLRNDTFSTANATISYANQIKNLADESKKIISNVFTVSIINNPSNQTNVYLGKTSSNWLNSTTMGDWNNSWNNTTTMWNNGDGTRNSSSTNFALTATTAEALREAFETISAAAGGSDADLGSATIATVDIVSTSFMLPDGADESSIKVYTAACTGGSKDAWEFGDYIPVGESTDEYYKLVKNSDGTIDWVDQNKKIDTDITVSLSATKEGGKKDKIEVNGFDYSSNFCGGPYGHKVVIEIPIKMDPDAVGGPGVKTNEEGSGIYADVDGDGVPDPIVTFESPDIDLPVNIHIQKMKLNLGESAKFKIQRIPKGTPQSTDWEDVTTVFLTKSSKEEEPIVKVRGLDPGYIYQIVEDDWSWSYNKEANTPTRTDMLITNPFIFTNTKKTGIDKKIRHAESKVTNIFNNGGSVVYDHSK